MAAILQALKNKKSKDSGRIRQLTGHAAIFEELGEVMADVSASKGTVTGAPSAPPLPPTSTIVAGKINVKATDNVKLAADRRITRSMTKRFQEKAAAADNDENATSFSDKFDQ
jgi:hypothetical protein